MQGQGSTDCEAGYFDALSDACLDLLRTEGAKGSPWVASTRRFQSGKHASGRTPSGCAYNARCWRR